MRVTGGELCGRRIRAPRAGVRPTADRVRESVFAALDDLEGMAVLDLYAGSGTLGIEALSRGALSVVFVEHAQRGVAVLRENLESLELSERASIYRADAQRCLRRLRRDGRRFDIVFADPPYDSKESWRVLAELASGDLLAAGARVVVEHARGSPLPPIRGLEHEEERRYGETVVTRLRRNTPGGTSAA